MAEINIILKQAKSTNRCFVWRRHKRAKEEDNFIYHLQNVNQNHKDTHLDTKHESSISFFMETSIVKSVEKLEALYNVGETSIWCSHHEQKYGGPSKHWK